MTVKGLADQKAELEERLARCDKLKAMFKNHPSEGGKERYEHLKDREAELKQRLYEVNLAIDLEMEHYNHEND